MFRSVRILALLTLLVLGALVLPFAYHGAEGEGAAPEPSPAPSTTVEASPSPAAEPSPTPAETLSPTPEPSPSPVHPSPAPSEPERSSAAGEPGPVTVELGVDDPEIETGKQVVLSVTVTNGGQAPLEDSELVVSVPAKLDFLSADPSGAGVFEDPGGTSVVFSGIDLAAGTSATFNVTARAVSAGQVVIEALLQHAGGTETSESSLTIVEQPSTDVSVRVSTERLLTEVGGIVRYRIVVRNPGTAPLEDVTVINLVPDEVHVIGAALSEGVDAVQVGRSGENEDVVWALDKLKPRGQVELAYTGEVVKAGDYKAENSVRVEALGERADSDEVVSYLASTEATGSKNPDFEPIHRRVVTEVEVTERVVLRSREATSPRSVTGGAPIPFTGGSPAPFVFAALGLIFAGICCIRFSHASNRKVVAAGLLLVVIAAACTAGSEDRPFEPGEPRVKGKQITRGGDGDRPNADETEDGSDGAPDQADPRGPGDGSGLPGRGDDEGPGRDDVSPVVEGDEDVDPLDEIVEDPVGDEVVFRTRTVRRARDVTIDADELATTTLGDVRADSSSLTWNDPSTSLGGGGSSSRFGAARLSTSLSTGSSAGLATVIVSNRSERRRLVLAGRLALAVDVPGGTVELAGPPIDLILNPGGEASTTFGFRLPSGRYGLQAVFKQG